MHAATLTRWTSGTTPFGLASTLHLSITCGLVTPAGCPTCPLVDIETHVAAPCLRWLETPVGLHGYTGLEYHSVCSPVQDQQATLVAQTGT